MHVCDGAGGICDSGERQRCKGMRQLGLIDDLDRVSIFMRPDRGSGRAVDFHMQLALNGMAGPYPIERSDQQR
jgi:hypothetical protein